MKNTLKFSDLFDLEEIQKIQDAFALASNVASIITEPDGTPITKPSNFCRLCMDIIRQTPKGLSNCMKSDAILGRQNPIGPIMQPCLSGGLWDGGAGISVGNIHVANWLIGQVRNETQNDEAMLKYGDEIGADREKFREALGQVTKMSTDQFKNVCNSLFLFANQLSKLAFQNLMLRQNEELLTNLNRELEERVEERTEQLVQSNDALNKANDELGIALKHLWGEMRLARKIQMSLLPGSVKNLHADMEISADMIPAENVGGDCYDIVFDRSGYLWFTIGDVSGHGVTPGLIMMMAQTIHTTITSNMDSDPRSLVVMINEILYKNVRERLREDHFMTFTALKYIGEGKFRHAGAHLSMIVYRKKTGICELIPTTGIYLNFKKDISRATRNSEFHLDPGDILILYTDGLTEAHSTDGEMLDIGGFVKLVEKHAHREPDAMKDMIVADVIKWCDDNRADDMSIVIVRMKEENTCCK